MSQSTDIHEVQTRTTDMHRKSTTFHPSIQSPRLSNTRSASQPQIGGPMSRINSRFTMQSIRHTLTEQMTPPKPVGQAPGVFQSIRTIVLASWLNVLLFCIPVSWALHFALPHTDSNDTLIFVFSFLAIIPLAKLLAFATDELSMRVGQTLAGLLNATLGNAVELIVSIIALIQCELQVVQSSLVGSILSNLLLVLGMCFFAGGTRFSEQGFGVSATQLNSSLLTVSVIAVLLPAAFHFTAGDQIPDTPEGKDVLSMSHGVALILLFIYACYLIFQLFSHKQLYDDADAVKSTKYAQRYNKDGTPAEKFWSSKFHLRHRKADQNDDLSTQNGSSDPLTSPSHRRSDSPEPLQDRTQTNASIPLSFLGAGNENQPVPDAQDLETGSEHSDGEEEVPSMSLPMTIGLLVVVTVIVAVTAEFLVSSINGLTDSGKISKEFVGLILLPIVGNAAEHVTAVTVSVKDKLTLSLGVAVGSSIQIALFVIPFIVTLGWIIGKPLTLLFDPFESIVLFLAVMTVNYVTQDGKSNWLEGMILMCLYVIIAVVFWYYPGVDVSGQLAHCVGK